ncbi:MAG TPA: hypothetical protein VII33_07345 [Nakamurella sp.]
MKAPNTTPQIPSRDDHGTTTCPVCRRVFTPTGRQAYCSTACRKTAFRRRHQQPGSAVTIPAVRPRREFTVYEWAPAAVNDSWASNAAKPAAPSPAGSASAVHAHIAMSPWP